MPIEVVREAESLQSACEAARRAGGEVAVVPTMGALHEGHVALVEQAVRCGSLVVVTIFVNPTQFGPNEDFARYPRDLSADLARLEGTGANLVFAPEAAEMYPEGDATRVNVTGLTDVLCGPFRPNHF
jgi:pantoate--beta-alanine ligase